MNHKLPLSEKVSKAVYSMGRFDATYHEDNRAMNILLTYMDEQVKGRAVKVCVEEFSADKDPDKAYDRGYVRGIYELLLFIKKSFHEEEVKHNLENN